MKLFYTILVDPVNNFMITLEKKFKKCIKTRGIEEICRVFQEVLQEPVFIEKYKHHLKGRGESHNYGKYL